MHTTSPYPRRRTRLQRSSGFTLLELLIGLAILAIALLALASGLATTVLGVRQDGQRTSANQVATSVIEDQRELIRTDASGAYDDAATISNTITVAGQSFPYTLTRTPYWIAASNDSQLLATGSGDPHLFEVVTSVTTPIGDTETYRTRIVRPPGGSP